MELDELDRSIIAELRADGRASVSAVAAATHTSRANAYARLGRLLDAKVITGFSARVDPIRAGLHSSAYVTLTLEQTAWHEIRAAIAQIPEVEHLALVGGDFDCILLVRARDNADLRRVVLEELQAIPGIRSTKTALVFEDSEMA